MNYQEYQQLFDQILSASPLPHPYDDEMYLNYTKLNQARMKRWDKLLKLDEELAQRVKAIAEKQHWIIITEPWCGDAAHLLPYMIQLAGMNELITYEIQLRDGAPFLIDQYLTNGTKGIPILIMRNADHKDILVWGPRPLAAQELMNELKKEGATFETIKLSLQNWYNRDKGVSFSAELLKNWNI